MRSFEHGVMFRRGFFSTENFGTHCRRRVDRLTTEMRLIAHKQRAPPRSVREKGVEMECQVLARDDEPVLPVHALLPMPPTDLMSHAKWLCDACATDTLTTTAKPRKSTQLSRPEAISATISATSVLPMPVSYFMTRKNVPEIFELRLCRLSHANNPCRRHERGRV